MKAFLVILLAFSLIPVSLGYTLGGTTFKGDVNMYGNNLSNLTAPVLDSDAATKAYADSVAIGGGLPNIWYDPESDAVRVYSNGSVKSLAYVA